MLQHRAGGRGERDGDALRRAYHARLQRRRRVLQVRGLELGRAVETDAPVVADLLDVVLDLLAPLEDEARAAARGLDDLDRHRSGCARLLLGLRRAGAEAAERGGREPEG